MAPKLTGDAPDLGTEPIAAEPYYRPEYFERERAAVFRRTWLQIAHTCELPDAGSFIVRPVEVAKTTVLLTRAKDGMIRAFHNVCSHRGTELVQESDGRRSSFSCPYHGWNYGNDGRLRSAPDFGNFYVDKAQCSLPTVAVDVCAGLIFINLDPHPAQTLTEFLGPLAAKLEAFPVARATRFSEYHYEIEANWKVCYDNFQENYHLRFIHPRSGAPGAAGPDNPFGYPSEYGFYGPHRTQMISSNPDFVPSAIQARTLGRLVVSALAKGLAPSTEYLATFPNFFIFGSLAQHFSHTVWPVSATRSRGVVRTYWLDDDTNASERFAREYAMATTLDIHAEDRMVIESGQRGLNSGALKHLHFQANEILLRHLYLTVDKSIADYEASTPRGKEAM
jgi:phenylpropionate dioxygenase-like ring-hydroxylating dioxygenase large terminal subunit